MNNQRFNVKRGPCIYSFQRNYSFIEKVDKSQQKLQRLLWKCGENVVEKKNAIICHINHILEFYPLFQ